MAVRITIIGFIVSVLFAVSPVAAQALLAADQDRREALRFYQTGQELMSAERFEEAAEAFRRSIEKDRLLTPSHYGLGQAYMALRRYTSAAIAFRDCLEAHRTLHGLAESGRVELERQRDEEIRELSDTIRRLRSVPNSNLRTARLEARIEELQRRRTSNTGGFVAPPDVLLALGSAYFRNERLDEAEEHWRTAIAANPRFGEAHNNLAALYAMTGRRADAEAAVRAAERAGFRVHPQLKDDIRQLPR